MNNSYNFFLKFCVNFVFICLFSGLVYSQGSVSGTVMYNDNNQPVSAGHVKAYDLNGIEIANTTINQDGSYLFLSLPPIGLDIIGFPDDELGDFIATYHPNKEDWETAVSIYPFVNLTDINIYVQRSPGHCSPFSSYINGTITSEGLPLKDAVVYAKVNGVSRQCGVTDANGKYKINGLTEGDYILVVHRIGCVSTQTSVSVKYPGLEMIDFNLNKVVKPKTNSIIKEFKLMQNYPNPFNPSTKISFDLPWAGNVKLTVYNSLGQFVKELLNEYKEAGSYTTEFNANTLSSGVYF
ncbi:MAG: carboxypeptidase regulatory-like domain-containing protein, partial [Ignavibacteria bacterium]